MSRKILFVDDEETLREAYSWGLESNGYTVVQAENGKDAMEKLKASSFDLVLTDILMPEHSGLHLIADIRNINKTIPIIAITGGGRNIGTKPILEHLKGLPVSVVLQKPVDFRVLFEKIEGLFTSPHAKGCPN